MDLLDVLLTQSEFGKNLCGLEAGQPAFITDQVKTGQVHGLGEGRKQIHLEIQNWL